MDSNERTFIFGEKEMHDYVFRLLNDIVEVGSFLTLNDIKDLVGLPRTENGDSIWWTSLNESETKQVLNGFILILPEPETGEHP